MVVTVSTEYYLRRAPKSCPTCGHDPMAEEVHIGHASGGWLFLWNGWRTAEGSPADRPLDRPFAWFKFLAEEEERGGAVVDEYGRTYQVTEFFDLVAQARDVRTSLRHSDLAGTRTVHVNGGDFKFHDGEVR